MALDQRLTVQLASKNRTCARHKRGALMKTLAKNRNGPRLTLWAWEGGGARARGHTLHVAAATATLPNQNWWHSSPGYTSVHLTTGR